MNGGVDVVLLMVLAVILAWTSAGVASGKCIESERQALLSLKRGFNVDDDWLSSWGDGEQQKECCNWEGVTCSNNTGHVVMLDLQNSLYDADTISPSLGELSHLNYLDLSGIHFAITPSIPTFIGSSTLLKYLNLSDCFLGGSIPPQLGNLSHLVYLDLSFNDMDGGFPTELTNMSSLRYLDLSVNGLAETMPPQLGNLLYLEHLDLSENAFTGTIPSQFKNLSRLEYLDLNPKGSDDGETMSLSSDLEWLSQLSTLRYLSLPGMNLSSASSWQRQVSGLSHLQHLDLNGCNLVDSMPTSSLASPANFSTLSFVDISNNSLVDTSFIFSWLMNSTSTLVTLRMNDNGLTGTIPETFGVKLMSSLEDLNLANNELEGQIPVSFFHIASLTKLDLSHNRFTGMLPDLSQLSSLQELRLQNNKLNGSIHEGIGQLSNLTELSLGNNLFKGSISEAHFSRLSNLDTLDLSHNAFVFNVSVEWAPPFDLTLLNLASCNLGPNFPRWLKSLMPIAELDISQAQISGLIPDWFWERYSMMPYLNLSYNHLEGIIPANLSHATTDGPLYKYHQTIDLSFNLFEGPIPAFISTNTKVFLSNNRFLTANHFLCENSLPKNTRFMDLSSNSLSGELRDCWIDFEELWVLDLSDNHFHGNIPKSLGSLTNIQSIHLGGNNFSGEIPSSLINCTQLQVFDAAHNKLSGAIPSWIGDNIRKLLVLGLHSNKFHGRIPLSMCNLNELRVLDLSQNILSGSIPTCLSNLSAMATQQNSNATITHDYKYYFCLRVQYHRCIYSEPKDEVYNDSTSVMWKRQMSKYGSTLGLLRSIDLS
ncbi:hypothetical protein PIB30_058593, partial [Stylosanthes scabra]|nr:hypothetical protein [Stylosanthes scabra]